MLLPAHVPLSSHGSRVGVGVGLSRRPHTSSERTLKALGPCGPGAGAGGPSRGQVRTGSTRVWGPQDSVLHSEGPEEEPGLGLGRALRSGLHRCGSRR